MTLAQTEKDLQLVLTATADRLTWKNLLEIVVTIKRADANASLRLGSKRISLGLPAGSRQRVEEALREIGYDCEVVPISGIAGSSA